MGKIALNFLLFFLLDPSAHICPSSIVFCLISCLSPPYGGPSSEGILHTVASSDARVCATKSSSGRGVGTVWPILSFHSCWAEWGAEPGTCQGPYNQSVCGREPESRALSLSPVTQCSLMPPLPVLQSRTHKLSKLHCPPLVPWLLSSLLPPHGGLLVTSLLAPPSSCPSASASRSSCGAAAEVVVV